MIISSSITGFIRTLEWFSFRPTRRPILKPRGMDNLSSCSLVMAWPVSYSLVESWLVGSSLVEASFAEGWLVRSWLFFRSFSRRFFTCRDLTRRLQCSPTSLVEFTTPIIKSKVRNTTFVNFLDHSRLI